LPENELHDIGILFAHLVLKMNGYNVVYLGQNLPYSSLLSLKEKNKIDNILFFVFSNSSRLNLPEINNFLETNFSESKINVIINDNLLGANNFQKLNTISSIDKFINLISI
jgi:methanogenic corrinoid protein MtbC1